MDAQRNSFKLPVLCVLTAMTITAGFMQVECQASAPSAVETPREQVKRGKELLAKGHVDAAIGELSKAAKTLGTRPGSCDCHYNLGKAYCTKAKLQKVTGESKANFLNAKKELRTAVRVGRGNVISLQANDYLMANLPPSLIAPKTGDGTETIAHSLGLTVDDRGGGPKPKAKVFEFYADWCDPCRQLKLVIAKVMNQYGDRIELKSFNVDDDEAQRVIDEYEVSPIPTIIYLSPDSKVMGYSIGNTEEQNVEKQIEKILGPGHS